MFDAERTRDMEARYGRFQNHFRAQSDLWDLINNLLDHNTVKIRQGEEHDLSLLVGASLGKAMKTFYGTNDLCLAGWGEDALILLRSNVNLLINLGYILLDPAPVERAADFIAFSYTERVKYLKRAHNVEKSPWKSTMSDQETRDRAKRWDDVRISDRAARVPPFHYTTGYAFYSSFEHSDAMALNGYIADWDEVGPRINAGPSDDHVAVAIGHNITVLADVLLLYCKYFKIERPDIFERIQVVLNSIKE